MEQEDLPVPQSAVTEDFGKLQYGCEHYRRRCKIRAPCCDRIFTCRHCHNEAMIECTPMPEEYNHEVSIHCNDCNHMSKVRFHILGHKCSQCNSFNTWRTSSGGRQ
ncbi:unnamed protein product [Citrullus colocynthis]|uniref:CHY-type domain-containing protein n=1 Tax=Citrullus colocynthis TaxID=252529 RepID=A0ABP0XPH1_9ROSI